MTWEIILSVISGILGVGLAITMTLIRIIYNSLTSRIDRLEQQLQDRLRTLGHEDRDIRSQIQGLSQLLIQAVKHNDSK